MSGMEVVSGTDQGTDPQGMSHTYKVPSCDPEKVAQAILNEISSAPRSIRPTRPVKPQVSRATRPPLKIQDGCNNNCAFCVVRLVRGPSTSLPADRVIDSMSVLDGQQIPEVVLTGINLGSWGRDLNPPTSLSSILNQILEKRFDARVRLSSVEPQEITKELIDLVAVSNPGICPHLHMPLQSGADSILSKMHRPYRRDEYGEIVQEVVRLNPEVAVGADIIVGLPGEGEKEFMDSMKLVEQLPLSYLHVFPFSPRPGTEAVFLKDTPSRSIIKARSIELRSLGKRKRSEFLMSQKGRKREAVIESRRCRTTKKLFAMTDNYISVLVEGEDRMMGSRVSVELKELIEGSCHGRII